MSQSATTWEIPAYLEPFRPAPQLVELGMRVAPFYEGVTPARVAFEMANNLRMLLVTTADALAPQSPCERFFQLTSADQGQRFLECYFARIPLMDADKPAAAKLLQAQLQALAQQEVALPHGGHLAMVEGEPVLYYSDPLPPRAQPTRERAKPVRLSELVKN